MLEILSACLLFFLSYRVFARNFIVFLEYDYSHVIHTMKNAQFQPLNWNYKNIGDLIRLIG